MKQHWQITTPAFEADHLNPSLNVSPWCGHRNFVYDLLNFLEPASVIELGTHYGCSFFAMCQSIKDNALPGCRLYAVDTWKGDELFIRLLCVGDSPCGRMIALSTFPNSPDATAVTASFTPYGTCVNSKY